jgi:hypothetical protein
METSSNYQSTVPDESYRCIPQKKKVQFHNLVKVAYTHNKEDYDRSSIDCDALTKFEAIEIIQMRMTFRKETEYLYRRRQALESGRYFFLESKKQMQNGKGAPFTNMYRSNMVF